MESDRNVTAEVHGSSQATAGKFRCELFANPGALPNSYISSKPRATQGRSVRRKGIRNVRKEIGARYVPRNRAKADTRIVRLTDEKHPWHA